MGIKFHSRIPAAKAQIKAAQLKAVTEVFEIDIKTEAKELSPVSETWPSIPESHGKKRMDTGHNRRTIDTEVEETEKGIEARLFTQSGYGGYLETGTARMPARPYLWPAFINNIKKVPSVMRRILRNG